MRKSKEHFRHEWKYLINRAEKQLTDLRLRECMQLDPHAGEGGYMIRSLYFDDYWNSAMEEKDAGVDNVRDGVRDMTDDATDQTPDKTTDKNVNDATK